MRIETRQMLLIVGMAITLLQGCGFQLRSMPLAEHMDAPLQVAPANSELARQLAAMLRRQGVDISQQAALQLRLDSELRDKRAIALTSRATAAEYRLSHQVRVSLVRGDRTLVAPTLIEARRNLVVRPAEAAGMEQEERILIAELEKELLDRIVRWLNFSLAGAARQATP